MPLLNGEPYILRDLLPSGLKNEKEVWLVRATGELFTDYETYLNRVRQYNEPIWTCSKTQRSGLTYIQAANSEASFKPIQNDETGKPAPVVKPTALQMNLTTCPFSTQMHDLDLQLLRRYLYTEARSYITTAAAPEPPKEVLASEDDNKETEVKKRRSSGHSKKDSDQSKSDAKTTPGTVKYTIYETLKMVGPHGASIAYLQQRLKESNIKTTWAENSARNCIASILGHDKAFVKLPKHGHYSLAIHHNTEKKEDQSEKRDFGSVENEVSSYPRNNNKCMLCHKAKHPDNSPLLLCDECPSAVHLACARDQEVLLVDENGPHDLHEIQCPYFCFKCMDKKKQAERQKAIRQKREEDKLKQREEKHQGEAPDRRRKDQERIHHDRHKPQLDSKKQAKFPIEDLLLGPEDHNNKEELITGPVLPDPDKESLLLLDVISLAEFLTNFSPELDDKSQIAEINVAELMYSLTWSLDSSLLRNIYLPLIKATNKIKMTGSDGSVQEARRWNGVLDVWTWPEFIKVHLQSQDEIEILNQVEKELNKETKTETEEEFVEKLFLELTPRTHLKILMSLLDLVSSSTLIRQATDNRLTEARRLESEIFKMKREVNKSSNNNTSGKAQSHVEAEPSPDGVLQAQDAPTMRKLRRRGKAEESPEIILQNKVNELEEQLEKCKVRSEALGFDRWYNGYYWFATLPECLCIINSTKDQIRCLRTKDELDLVMTGLSNKGTREKQLLQTLKEEYENLVCCLAEKEFSFDLEQIPRGIQCVELELFYKTNKKQSKMTYEKLKEEYVALATKTMTSRLQKLVGSLATVDSETCMELKSLRFEIHCLVDLNTIRKFLEGMKDRLKRIFDDGNEKQNGKNHNRLIIHLDSLDNLPQSVSQLVLFVNILRDSLEPLIRSKNSKQQLSLVEVKRKRNEEKLSNSEADEEPQVADLDQAKKQKQKHESSADMIDIEAILAMSGRKTRSQVRNFAAISAQEVSQLTPNQTESQSSEISANSSDQDYEVDRDDDDEAHEESIHDDTGYCKVCGFGGRLVKCQGKDCEYYVHRGCMFGGNSRPMDLPWYCSKCSRENRAQQRQDKQRL
eukprot:g6940.t1